MENNYEKYEHSVGKIMLHLEWCTKYRYKMFRQDKYQELCTGLLREIAVRHNIVIREVFVMPEHIHMSVEIPPAMSQSKALQLLKGGLSYQLFRANEHFRLRYPQGHFFSPGGLANSTGYNTVDVADNYVRTQCGVHQMTLNSF